MSTDTHKSDIRHFHDAFNAGDLDAAIACFDSTAVIHSAGAPQPLSVEEFRQLGQAMQNAFPDGKSTVEHLIAEGNKVACQITFRGTHTGEMMGIPATGKSVIISEMIVDRFADGKIVESWRLFDRMGMMQQLGVIPAPENAG